MRTNREAIKEINREHEKRSNNRMNFLAALGAGITIYMGAQQLGCGAYEPKYIPEVRARNADGFEYISAQERAQRNLEMEEDNYTARLKREHEITVLPGDTLEGIAKEVYGYRDAWKYVLDSNSADYVAEGYPRIFGQNPELKEDFAFKEGFNPNKDLKAGMRIRVYFENLDRALSYSKEHPKRSLM